MNVLFVCTGNTCRSPMAEGILKDIARKENLDINVRSAGMFALDGKHISKQAIDVMKDIGIDILDYKSTTVHSELILQSDLILTMGKGHKQALLDMYPEARERIFVLKEYAFGRNRDIEDPFGGSKSNYERARDEIYHAIKRMLSS